MKHTYNSLHFGETADATRISIQLAPDSSFGNHHTCRIEHTSILNDTAGYGFVDSIKSGISIYHSVDLVKLDMSAFDNIQDITHSTTTPRVISIVS